MSYQAVKTDDGLEIRDKNGNVVWGPSESYAWPPNNDMMDAVFNDASISNPTKDVLRLLVGDIKMQDQTTDE